MNNAYLGKVWTYVSGVRFETVWNMLLLPKIKCHNKTAAVYCTNSTKSHHKRNSFVFHKLFIPSQMRSFVWDSSRSLADVSYRVFKCDRPFNKLCDFIVLLSMFRSITKELYITLKMLLRLCSYWKLICLHTVAMAAFILYLPCNGIVIKYMETMATTHDNRTAIRNIYLPSRVSWEATSSATRKANSADTAAEKRLCVIHLFKSPKYLNL